MTSLRFLCLIFLFCILDQSKGEYASNKHPSMIGNLLRMGGDFKHQLADTADNAVNTFRGIFKGGSNALLENTRRVGVSVDKSLDSTDSFARAGLDAGRNYIDTGYTALSSPPRIANDVVLNSVNEIQRPRGNGGFYTGGRFSANMGLEGDYGAPQASSHLELVSGTGERYRLNDQDVRYILMQMTEADRGNSDFNGRLPYDSPASYIRPRL